MEGNIKKYKIIYADPPWKYNRNKVKGNAESHYPCMDDEDIYSLPIDRLADDNSVLFLWTTFPKLKEGIKTIERWGFNYKTIGFIWLKQNRKALSWFFGLGFWTRGNAEICLLGVRGKIKRESNKVHQFIISPIERHSKKPDITRDKIIELMGDLPKIELFARQKNEGWDVWGNEVESSIKLEDYEEVV